MLKKIIKKLAIRFLGNSVSQCSFPVFLLHGVIPNPGPLFQKPFDNIEPDIFEAQLKYLQQHFEFISLHEAVQQAREGKSLQGKCALTFDDGYSCLARYAFPVLEKLKIPATVFLISDLINDQSYYWRDQVHFMAANDLADDFIDFLKAENKTSTINNTETSFKSWTKDPSGPQSHVIQSAINNYFSEKNITLPKDHQTGCKNFYLTEDEINNAPPLIEFGNHTQSHPMMPTLTLEEQMEEIKGCKAVLQGIKNSVPLFGLPFGAYNDDTLQAAKTAGYETVIYHNNRHCNKPGYIKEGKIDRCSLPSDQKELAWSLLRSR